MLEAGKENVFLKEKCEKCLQTIVEGKWHFSYLNILETLIIKVDF